MSSEFHQSLLAFLTDRVEEGFASIIQALEDIYGPEAVKDIPQGLENIMGRTDAALQNELLSWALLHQTCQTVQENQELPAPELFELLSAEAAADPHSPQFAEDALHALLQDFLMRGENATL